jgi:hypothetical protein
MVAKERLGRVLLTKGLVGCQAEAGRRRGHEEGMQTGSSSWFSSLLLVSSSIAASWYSRRRFGSGSLPLWSSTSLAL